MATNKKAAKPVEQKPEKEVIDGPEPEATETQPDVGPAVSDAAEVVASGETVPEASEVAASDEATDDAPAENTSDASAQPASEAPAITITEDSLGVELPADLSGYTVAMSIREATGEPGLHDLLSKAARHATSTHAGQESVFALHQLEMLTGRLKVLIPDGIAATKDTGLQSALNTLLSLL